MTVPTVWRNPLSTLAVFLCLVGLIAIAPASHKLETELRCDASGSAKAVFSTMDACVEESRRIGACGCHSIENNWARWYVLGVAPLVATVLANLLLAGSLLRRLALLNLAVASAVLAQFVWSLSIDPAAAMVVPLIPAFVGGFCAGATVVFLLLHFARRMAHRESAT